MGKSRGTPLAFLFAVAACILQLLPSAAKSSHPAQHSSDVSHAQLRRPWHKGGPICDEFDDKLLITGNLGPEQFFLRRVDLRTGRALTKILPGEGHGHSAVVSPAERIGWLIPENGGPIYEFDLDSLKIRHAIGLGDGRMAGGHGSCSPDGKLLYFVDRPQSEKSLQSRLIVYDVKHRRVIKRYPDVGIFAHDVKLTSDGRFAAVASYGSVIDFMNGAWCKNGGWYKNMSPKTMRIKQPLFAVIDLASGKVVLKKTFPRRFILTHVAIDAKGQTAFFQGTGTKTPTKLTAAELTALVAQRGQPLTMEEKMRDRIFLAGILLKLDLASGRISRLAGVHQCRSQSIAVSGKSDKVYNSFAVSKTISITDADPFGNSRTIDCTSVGLLDPRGLAETRDGRFLVVTDRQKNIYFMDAQKEVFRKDLTLLSNTHFSSHISLFR
jgi:hypothetical protein